jgi:hypothetical protein
MVAVHHAVNRGFRGRAPVEPLPRHPRFLRTFGPNAEIDMPAKSKAQQQAAGAALSAKRGEKKKGELKGPSKGMYESMSKSELKKMAETKRKGKPEHKSKS